MEFYEAPKTMSPRQKQFLLFVTVCVIVFVLVKVLAQSADGKSVDGQNKVLSSSWWWPWDTTETTAPEGTQGALRSYWDRIWGTPTPTTDKPMPTEAPGGYEGSPYDWWHEYGRDQGYQRPQGHTQSAWQKQVITHPRNYYGNDDHKRKYENEVGTNIPTLPIVIVCVGLIGLALYFTKKR